MKVLYAVDTDGQGRHYVYAAVYDRDWFSFSHSINVPLAELEIDEIDGNRALCVELVRSLRKRDAANDQRYMVDAAGGIIEKVDWEQWIDPNDVLERPTLAPAVWVKAPVAVDEDMVRLKELSAQPALSDGDVKEILGLIIERQARTQGIVH